MSWKGDLVSTLRKRWRTIWNIPRLIRTFWAMMKNPRVPRDMKLIVIILGLAYFIWPFDLIPEFPIPLLGYIDDFGVIFLLLNWFVNRSPREEHIDAEYYIVDNDEGKKEE